MDANTVVEVRWYAGDYSSGWLLDAEQYSLLQPTGITWFDRSIGAVLTAEVAQALTNNPDAWSGGLMGGVLRFTWADVERVAQLVREDREHREARRAQVELVKCSCGHTVPREWVMSAALGTSCPDCYDRMSGC